MDQNRNNPNHPQDGNPPEKNKPRNIWTALIITLALVLIFSWIFNAVSNSQYTETTYSDFLDAMESGNLQEVEIRYDRIVYLTKDEADKPAQSQKACFTGLRGGGDTMALAQKLHDMGVTVNEPIVEDNSTIMMVLYYGISIAVLFLFMRMLTKRMSGDGMMGGFGKSKAKMYMEKQTGVTAQGRSAGGFPRNRQNSPCQGCSRRGKCALLLHLRLRLCGDVRGHGRKPCPGPVPAGGEGCTLHYLHR